MVAVFIDTGLEFPELKQFVKTIDNVIWIKPEMSFRKVIETYGYPIISKEVSQHIATARTCPSGKVAAKFDPNSATSKKYNGKYSLAKWRFLLDSDIPISNKCCIVMKKTPAKKFEKQSGLKPITAMMACESELRTTNWLKNGCNAFDTKRPISHPMSFWTEQDVLEYLRRFKIPYASVYGDIAEDKKGKLYTTGCDRTGCVFCAYGCYLQKSPNKFQKLKATHPQLHDYCMRPWERGGLNMAEVLDFIGVKHDWEDAASNKYKGENNAEN